MKIGDEVKINKIGEIDGIELFNCALASGWTIGYNNAKIDNLSKLDTNCKCEKCLKFPTAKSAGKTYEDIKFVIGHSTDLKDFQKKLEQHKKYLKKDL